MRLGKLITLTLLLAAGIASAQAQTHYRSRVYLGAQAGADMSQVMFNPSTKQSLKPGMQAGVAVRYVEESHFGLIAELNFVQRGWKENFEGAPFNYSRTLNYLELPVLAHIFFGHRGRFFFNAGPQIGVLLSESTSANFNAEEIENLVGFPDPRRNDQMLLPAKNKIDYGISAGLGGEFFLNPRNSLRMEARVYYGLGNVFGAKRSDVFQNSNQLTLGATLGYWFRIK